MHRDTISLLRYCSMCRLQIMLKTAEVSPQAGELLEMRYIPVAIAAKMLFAKNPKKHDIGQLCASIAEYGFRDPPAFDINLGAAGAIVYGNGRVEALALMEKDGWDLPRGIGTAEDGAWVMPVMFGCDAKSKAAAEAFVVDHNNLTMAGGEFTALDMSRMYEMEGYLALLDGIKAEDPEEMPRTVDMGDLELLFEAAAGAFDPEGGGGAGGSGEYPEEGGRYEEKFGVLVECSDSTGQERTYNELISYGYKCRILTV